MHFYSLSLSLSLSLSQARRLVALDNFSYKPTGVWVNYSSLKNAKQNIVVNAIKELPYITLKCVAWLRAVLAHGAKHISEYLDAFVRTFTDAAREGIRDIGRFENRVQGGKHGMVQHSVTNARLINMSELRVLDVEVGIGPMFIALGLQITLKAEYIALKLLLKCEHVFLHPLTTFEFIPRTEERLGGSYLFEDMFVSFHV